MPDVLTPHEVLIVYLRNIAAGSWNAGRDPDERMTVNEYARECLAQLGLLEPGE